MSEPIFITVTPTPPPTPVRNPPSVRLPILELPNDFN